MKREKFVPIFHNELLEEISADNHNINLHVNLFNKKIKSHVKMRICNM